ncbi:MAG: 3-oxoacyl-ACP synthase III [Bdellovibrionales bacterium]|nr:3-oxoacyl-ACP synthase III [Bdellovibrionales bacterium]
MLAFPFKSVCIESFALHLPTYEVTSAEIEDRLAPLYDRLKVPYGTLEKVSGVHTRRFWDPQVNPSEVATEAAKRALDHIGFDREHIGAVFNTSVTRDFFEPATSALVHGNLELPETVIAIDITNACIGFSNGMQLLGNLIESGVVKAGIVTSGENIARIIESSFKLVLEDETLQRDDLLRLLPTFTLGCGAAAMVLCHESIATSGHKLNGCVSRTASQHNMLCKGNGDFHINQRLDLNPIMHTESQGLIGEAAKLGRRMWDDFSKVFHWERDDIDHIFCHQVGKQVNKAFYKEMTLDMKKEFTTYQRFGNLVSSSLPAAFFTGVDEKNIQSGEKILLTAFGSGLNSNFVGITW